METIETFESGSSFEDEMAHWLQRQGQDLDVMYDESGEFTVTQPGGESFRVQFCPASQLPADTLQGGLWVLEIDAPCVEVDGVEYVALRQW